MIDKSILNSLNLIKKKSISKKKKTDFVTFTKRSIQGGSNSGNSFLILLKSSTGIITKSR